MASPTAADVHVNRPLTNITIAFMQREPGFIADKVFPNIPVEHKSDDYHVYKRDSWNRPQAKPRARATESAGGGWEYDKQTYSVERYAFHKDIDDTDRANQDSVFNLDREATEFVARQLLLTRESVFASTYFKAGVWSRNLTGVSGTPSTNEFKQWDQAGSDPIGDIQEEVLTQTLRTGFKPNKLVLGPQVLTSLKNHAAVLERIKYSQKAVGTVELLAELFEIDEVLVPYPILNTAKEGAAESNAFFYGKGALLVYAAPTAGIMTPSAGYTFNWRRYMGTSSLTPVTKKFRMEEITSDRVESELSFDMKVVAQEMGTWFGSAVS